MSAQTDLQLRVYNTLKDNDYSYVVTLVKEDMGTYDPADGTAPITSTSDTCYIVYDTIENSKALPEEEELRKGESFAVIAGNGVIPIKGDKLTISGSTKSIRRAVENSAGMNALFEIIIGA